MHNTSFTNILYSSIVGVFLQLLLRETVTTDVKWLPDLKRACLSNSARYVNTVMTNRMQKCSKARMLLQVL